MVDIASRVWNRRWKIDPIVRSLIDTDFYKLLMCQSVRRNAPDTRVTFSLINRSRSVRLAELIDEGELREQLDHIRSLSLGRGESTWLRGNTFYGKRQMFTSEFMEWFEALRLPPYHLERRDGQYELTFEGAWPEVMLWEIPALAVLMELRSRAVLQDMGRFELQVLYARAMTKLWEKVERLRDLPGLRVADFGTRRRHSFLWQDWCVQAMEEGLGPAFTGTSNCLIAQRRDLEAIGTNAHELPMVRAALARDDEALRRAPYDVLADWHEEHEGNLRVILPDTFGTGGLPRRRARLARGLDGDADRLGRPGRGRRGRDRLVARARRGPAREAGDLLRRARRRAHRRSARALRRPGAGQLRLGDAAHQRLPRPGARRRAGAVLAGMQGGGCRGPPDGEAVGQPEEGDGPRGRGRALQARVRDRRPGGAGGGGMSRWYEGMAGGWLIPDIFGDGLEDRFVQVLEARTQELWAKVELFHCPLPPRRPARWGARGDTAFTFDVEAELVGMTVLPGVADTRTAITLWDDVLRIETTLVRIRLRGRRFHVGNMQGVSPLPEDFSMHARSPDWPGGAPGLPGPRAPGKAARPEGFP